MSKAAKVADGPKRGVQFSSEIMSMKLTTQEPGEMLMLVSRYVQVLIAASLNARPEKKV